MDVLVEACLGCKYDFPADHRRTGVADPKEGMSVSAAEAATSPRNIVDEAVSVCITRSTESYRKQERSESQLNSCTIKPRCCA